MPDAVGLRLDTANLVGLVIQAFMYGIFQALFFGCVYVLVYLRKTSHINWHFLFTAILMWILIGANFALSWSRVMDAFIGLQPDLREDPGAIMKYFQDMAQWKEVARTCCYIGLTAVADTLLIYRCFIVWSHNKFVILFPLLLLCGTVTSGLGVIVTIGAGAAGIFSQKLAGWATSFLCLSLAQNLLTTFLIVYRIWRVNVSIAILGGPSSLWPVMAVVLESGVLYSSLLLVLLVLYASGNVAQYVALDMLVPTIGVVFNLIIVRVGLGLSRSPTGRSSGTAEPVSTVRFPMQKLSISVSQHVSVSRDVEQVGSTIAEGKCDFSEEQAGWKDSMGAVAA